MVPLFSPEVIEEAIYALRTNVPETLTSLDSKELVACPGSLQRGKLLQDSQLKTVLSTFNENHYEDSVTVLDGLMTENTKIDARVGLPLLYARADDIRASFDHVLNAYRMLYRISLNQSPGTFLKSGEATVAATNTKKRKKGQVEDGYSWTDNPMGKFWKDLEFIAKNIMDADDRGKIQYNKFVEILVHLLEMDMAYTYTQRFASAEAMTSPRKKHQAKVSTLIGDSVTDRNNLSHAMEQLTNLFLYAREHDGNLMEYVQRLFNLLVILYYDCVLNSEKFMEQFKNLLSTLKQHCHQARYEFLVSIISNHFKVEALDLYMKDCSYVQELPGTAEKQAWRVCDREKIVLHGYASPPDTIDPESDNHGNDTMQKYLLHVPLVVLLKDTFQIVNSCTPREKAAMDREFYEHLREVWQQDTEHITWEDVTEESRRNREIIHRMINVA